VADAIEEIPTNANTHIFFTDIPLYLPVGKLLRPSVHLRPLAARPLNINLYKLYRLIVRLTIQRELDANTPQECPRWTESKHWHAFSSSAESRLNSQGDAA
jgi:hypothetical protein